MEAWNAEYKRKISIHALREEGDLPGVCRWSGRKKISIHALREEGDRWIWRFISASSISIHALREEGDELNNGFGSAPI